MKPSMTSVVPTSPVSSPTMAKMKSVWASGSQPYFSIECPIPTPKNPPDASPYRDCVAWKPAPSGSAHGFLNAVRRPIRYGSSSVTAMKARPSAPPSSIR